MLDIWNSVYIMRFLLVSYSDASAMNFSLILYIYGFHLLRLAPLSFSVGSAPYFLQFTAVNIPSVNAIVFCQHWWSSSHVRFFRALSTFTCTMVSFFNVLKYLFYVVFNASFNFLFSSKSCSFSSFAASKRFSIWLIFYLNQLVLVFQLSISAVISQNCLISHFRLLNSFAFCQIFALRLELVSSRFKVYNFPGFLSGIAFKWGLALIGVLGALSANLSSNKVVVCDRMTLGSAIGRLSSFYF